MAEEADVPRRDGVNRFGPFTGGSALNIDYQLVSPTMVNYRSISQLRTIKTLTATEQMLHRRRDDISIPKFNGSLNTSASASTTELNKTHFEEELSRLIKMLGLQNFFYVLSHDQTQMIYLPENAHKVTIGHVIGEYQDRLIEPDAEYTTGPNGLIDLQESITARFICYDSFELNDIHLSCLAVDALISAAIRLQVTTRFRHDPNFEDYPGSVLLMMIYEVVNASTSLDISHALKDFEALVLVNYPGENISTFIDEVLRLIHILECAYALPYQLGSQLLEKVQETSSTYFNIQVQLLLHEAKTMEDTVGPISDPKSLENHQNYGVYGPIALCAALQTLYTGLLKSNSWPALAESIPQSNTASTNLNYNNNCNQPESQPSESTEGKATNTTVTPSGNAVSKCLEVYQTFKLGSRNHCCWKIILVLRQMYLPQDGK